MGTYFRRPEMVEGGRFRCYNCGKLLIIKLDGSDYEVELKCPRCKAFIRVKMREPLNWKKKSSTEEVQSQTT